MLHIREHALKLFSLHISTSFYIHILPTFAHFSEPSLSYLHTVFASSLVSQFLCLFFFMFI